MTPRQWRIKQGLTHEEVGKMLGITTGHACNLELGRRFPSARLARKYEEITKGRVRLNDFPAMQGEQ